MDKLHIHNLTVIIQWNGTLLHSIAALGVSVGGRLGVESVASSGVIKLVAQGWFSEPHVALGAKVGTFHNGVVQAQGRLSNRSIEYCNYFSSLFITSDPECWTASQSACIISGAGIISVCGM